MSNKRKSSLDETISNLTSHPEIISSRFNELNDYMEGVEGIKNPNTHPQFKLSRFFFGFFFLLFAFSNSWFGVYVPTHYALKIKDYLIIYTETYFKLLVNNPEMRKILVNITAGVQDLVLVTLSIKFVISGKTWRPVIAFIFFMAFKLLNTMTFKLLPMENLIWDSPYFSFTYPSNGDSNYFAGSIGANFLCFEFLFDIGGIFTKLISVLALGNSLFQIVFFMSLRAAYSIDLIISILIAHYFYYLSELVDPYIQYLFPIREMKASDSYPDNIEVDEIEKKNS